MRLDVGDSIPEVTVQLQDGSQRPLSSWRGRWLVLFFYPKDNTPGCTLENRDFSALLEDFQAAGAEVVGVSRDSLKSHLGFCSKQGLRHLLIADTEQTLCQAFDVIQPKQMYGREVIGIERSSFLIDPQGKVARVWRKLKVAGHAAAVLAALHESRQ